MVVTVKLLTCLRVWQFSPAVVSQLKHQDWDEACANYEILCHNYSGTSMRCYSVCDAANFRVGRMKKNVCPKIPENYFSPCEDWIYWPNLSHH